MAIIYHDGCVYFPAIGFLLQGQLYGNNSIVTISDIGERDNAFLCITNNNTCCNTDKKGNWSYPSGSAVESNSSGDDLYRNRGRSVVRLHRRNNSLSPTGMYRCDIPDNKTSDLKSIYIGLYRAGEGVFNVYFCFCSFFPCFSLMLD